jgi:hypothetical protein
MKDVRTKASHRRHIRHSQLRSTISYLVIMFRRAVYLLPKLHVFVSHISLFTAITLKTDNICAQSARQSVTLYIEVTH